MKIAFTHNLQTTASEEEAEFDRPETVAAITEALRNLGHIVEPVEVSGPASRIIARLEALNPDLIFNTAEGSHGRFREAFFPALFEQLGIPFTGSDAYVCGLTLDKNLSKMVVGQYGVPTPKWKIIYDKKDLESLDLKFPVICKPNFEGSSIGITQDSIVDNKALLTQRVENLLKRFPSGLLIEEFIEGRDVVVAYLEKGSPKTGGVLEPALYTYPPKIVQNQKYFIYDYDLKNELSDSVTVQAPADLPAKTKEQIMTYAKTVFRVLGIRDLGRIDFRLSPTGEIFFLEVNALPSLEDGAAIFLTAKLAGLETKTDVIQAVIESAADRYGLDAKSFKRIRSKRKKTLIGVTFNLKRIQNSIEHNIDDEAEFDSQSTIRSISDALKSFGHDVIEMEANPELPSILPTTKVDLVFNIAEGFGGRTREAQVPALLELLGIPYTGSDPTSISLCHDKSLAKRIVSQAGINTAPFFVLSTGKEPIPKNLTYPLIVKPTSEGSSKGVHESSVVTTEKQLRDIAKAYIDKYRQTLLVESFLPGREFTVGLIGEYRPKVLPITEIVFTNKDQKHPVYSFASKIDERDIRIDVPADIKPALQKKMSNMAKKIFTVLGCRDYARIDFRLSADGKPYFLECNPLPGVVPDFSDLCLMAKAGGLDYRSLIGELLAPAQRRYREKMRKQLLIFGDRL